MKKYIKDEISRYVEEHNEKQYWREPLTAFGDEGILFFVPFSSIVNDFNKTPEMAPENWVKANREADELADGICNHLKTILSEKGFDAEAAGTDYPVSKKAAEAGLGTMGLHNRLITKKGCSGKLGAVIAALDVEPDRPMTEELCLYKKNGICAVCVRNCVAQAFHEDYFDEFACREICQANSVEDINPGDNICGKCVSYSPCAYKR